MKKNYSHPNEAMRAFSPHLEVAHLAKRTVAQVLQCQGERSLLSCLMRMVFIPLFVFVLFVMKAQANDSPTNAIMVNYSPNMAYPNCYPLTGDNSAATNSVESTTFSGPDRWYKFISQSTAVRILMQSTTMDDVIELYSYSTMTSNYTLVAFVNLNSGLGDAEELVVQNLTPLTTYYISVGAESGSVGGSFNLCIQNLLRSGCAYAIPVNGFSLCGLYKAVYRGSPTQGVTYDFHFTGVGGGASGTTSIYYTNGLISLSNPTLALRHGGIYNVQVDVRYTLASGVVLIAGSHTTTNCSSVKIADQPLIEVKLQQRCPVILSHASYLIGRPVPGNTAACAAVSYTFEFTNVTACSNGTVAPPPVLFNSSSTYLNLGVLPTTVGVGFCSVRIRPNYSYGIGIFGPPQVVSIQNACASIMLPDSQLEDSDQKIFSDALDASVFPNPNDGRHVRLFLADVPSEVVNVRILDGIGREVFTNRYPTEGTLDTEIRFSELLQNGLYFIEFKINDTMMMKKMLVEG